MSRTRLRTARAATLGGAAMARAGSRRAGVGGIGRRRRRCARGRRARELGGGPELRRVGADRALRSARRTGAGAKGARRHAARGPSGRLARRGLRRPGDIQSRTASDSAVHNGDPCNSTVGQRKARERRRPCRVRIGRRTRAAYEVDGAPRTTRRPSCARRHGQRVLATRGFAHRSDGARATS